MTKAVEMSGQRFGKLVVIKRDGSGDDGKAVWLCVCDCGQEKSVLGKSLRSGNTTSCGCLAAESRASRGKTHGMTYSPEYRTWCRIKNRCYNPRVKDYPQYGGRGISMCAAWRNSFDAFLIDMGRRPSAKYSIDRKDNSGNYEPDNCRWATPYIQANNKRSNRQLTAFGRTQNLSQWAREYGMERTALKQRLARGWAVDRAISEPVS